MVDGLNTSSFTPMRLIGGQFPRETRDVLVTGGAPLVSGSMLGRAVTPGAVTAAADGSNTGNGVFSGQVTAAGAQIGNYRVIAIEPNTNLGTFEVFDPKGLSIGRYIVGAAAFSNQIGFSIADGATDFVAGDAFTVTVAAGAEKFKLAALASVDGSQEPCAVLIEACDPSGGDVTASVYLTGEFLKSAVTFGTGLTAANTLWDLSKKNIYLRDSVQ